MDKVTSYQLKFKASVNKDLKNIGKTEGLKIIKNIKEKLLKNPKLGIPLQGYGKTLWRHRIGDYRVIYSFNDKELWVLIVHIAHRKEVYKNLPS